MKSRYRETLYVEDKSVREKKKKMRRKMFNHKCEHCWGKYFKLLEKQKLESCSKQDNKETTQIPRTGKRWTTATSSANKITVLGSMKEYNQLIMSRYLHLHTGTEKDLIVSLILTLFKIKVFLLIHGNLLRPSIYLISKEIRSHMYKRRMELWPLLQKWYIFSLFNYFKMPAIWYIFFSSKALLCLVSACHLTLAC